MSLSWWILWRSVSSYLYIHGAQTNRRKLFEASLTMDHLYGDLEQREGMKQRILGLQNQLMSVYELDSSLSFQAIESINSVMNQYLVNPNIDLSYLDKSFQSLIK